MEPAHPLDRPVWSALTTRQAGFAQGDARAWRFAPEYGPFAAAADYTLEHLDALAALIPVEGSIAVVEPDEIPVPAGTAIVQTLLGSQMLLERLTSGARAFAIEALTDADAPDMLALATATKPGPFAARTHQLGNFVGVKLDGRLVAMVGERMKPESFTEISGLCTYPEYRGQGYGGALMRVVAERILARGETPFLHVDVRNAGAIALYEALGFRSRRVLTMTVLTRSLGR